MGFKRVISIFFFILIFLALLIFAAMTGFFIYAPGYLESKIIPDLMKKAGINLFSLHVRNVGISGAELSDVRFGDGILPGIEIDSIRIDYSPLGLFHRKIEKVVLSGISIPLEYKDKIISITGLDLSNIGGGSSSDGLSIGSLAIRHSRLLFNWEDKELDFPFDMDLMFTRQDLTPDRILLKLYPRGQVVKIAGNINHDKKTISIFLSSEDLLLAAFSDIINNTTGLNAGGMVNLNVSIEASFNPFNVSGINASLQLNRGDIGYEDLLLASNYNDGDKESPIVIQLKSGDLQLWEFDISRFLISTPVGPILTAAGGNLRIGEKDISADAVFKTNLSEIKGNNNFNTSLNGIGITKAPSLRWKVSAVMQKNGPWQIQADVTGHAAEKTPTCGFMIDGAGISSGTPEIHFNAKAEGKDLSASYRLKIPSIRIDNKTTILTMDSITVSGLYKGPYKEPEKGKTSFSVKVSDIGMNSGAISANAPKVDINGTLVSDAEGGLNVTADLAFSGAEISSGTPEIPLNAKAEDKDISASYRLEIPAVRIDNKTTILTMHSITVSGLYKGPYKEPGKGKASFSLKVSDIGMDSGAISAKAPEVDINGNLVSDGKGDLSVTGDLAFTGAGISFKDQGITVGDISGDIPFQWPFKVDGRSGNIDVESIRSKDLELGEIKTAIQQKKNDFIFNGKYISRLFPDFIMELSGTAGFIGEDKETLINISLPDYKFPPDTDLKIIAPGLKDTLFQGSVTLSAGISFSGAVPRGKVSMGIREAQIKVAGKDLILDGLSGELNFTDIFSLKSAPKQSLKISKVSFRDLKADNLMIDFQIESKGSIFIEQCRFNWCQGHVSIQPFRFSPGIDDYRFTLNCDRLNLAAIMEQFGVAKATGNGAVNGTIPIILSKGQFTFEDGFLYSTPGDGGNIHVTGAEALIKGIPPDSDQYMQMEIAREALKDFEYKWAKMSLSTEGSDMVMKLQFDGKPANPLPFVYKKDIGKFIKLETDAKGSVFEGISLDINFRLPLNDILKYKDILF